LWWEDLLINLLASFVWFILGVAGTSLVAFFVLVLPGQKRKKQLIRFFDLDPENPVAIIYLSNLITPHEEQFHAPATFRYQQGDQKIFIGSFRGSAVPSAELGLVTHISMALQNDPLQGWPGFLQKLLVNRWKAFRPVHVSFRVSPNQALPFFGWRFETLLTVGSGTYNSVTNYYDERREGRLELKSDPYRIIALQEVKQGQEFYPTDPEKPGGLAILEKIVDSVNGTTVFIASGAGALGTMGAVQYLMREWESLYKQFGNTPFSAVMEFRLENSASMDELHPSSIHFI